MAEVHLLPVRVNVEGARRLADTLTAMIEDGGDPGGREAHIQSLGLSLEELVQRLRAELTRLGVAERLAGPMSNLERLATSARTYRADASS
ncbi:MAG: hypothetical protein K2X54_09075 [Methylobacterium organophilum]|nr:hypothetical protein [Methylobacterium organophilum]